MKEYIDIPVELHYYCCINSIEDFNKPGHILIITGILLLLLMLSAVFSIPLVAGDLFIALAAGRDVLAGELNSPDTWSFSTGGRVWINQNWGASLLLYLVQQFFGGTGLLAVKFVLLALCPLFLILAMLERKVSPVIALTAAAAVAGALNVYVVFRPNLFTLVFLCLELWLLERTANRPRSVWLVVPLIGVWANVHGGFILGLGLLALFSGCIMIPGMVTQPGLTWKKQWHFPAAFSSALLLAGFANPFGLKNLTFPFLMMQGSVWHTVRDWLPIWEFNQLYFFRSGIIGFLAMAGMILLLAGIRLVCHLFRLKKQIPGQKAAGTGEWKVVMFESILTVIAVVMAVRSNRFIAIALPVLAIPLALQLKWLVDYTNLKRVLPAVLQGCLLLISTMMIRDNLRNYDPANPFLNTGTGTLFERMHYVNENYNDKLIQFINSNHITGNVFNPWIWEGYLRLNCPQLKVFIGGRAQQVYNEEAFDWYQYLTGNQVPAFKNVDPVQLLRSLKADMIITSHAEESGDLIITALRAGNWVIVYADERDLLFVNISRSVGTELATLFTAGELKFPNPATAAMSRAACYFSQPDKWETVNLLELFTEAWDYYPFWLWSYKMLYSNLQYDPALFGRVIRLLENQLTYLDSLPLDDARAADRLRCRIYLGDELTKIARQLNQEKEAMENYESFLKSKESLAGLYKKWQQWLINRW